MEIIHLEENALDSAAKRASHALRQGSIILYPTDTIYGLGVNAFDEGAIERLRALKGGQRKKPISIIVDSVESIEKYGILTPVGKALAEKHFPGSMTLVVKAAGNVPESLQLNGTIGIRIPNDPFCLALAKEFKQPYTTTSANLAGRETVWNVLQVLAQFRENAQNIELVVDAGERAGSRPSTVVLATGDEPFVLFQGSLSREELGIPLHATPA